MLWTQNRGLCQCIQTGLRFYIKLIRKALLWNKQGLKPIAIVDIDVVYNFMVIDQFIYTLHQMDDMLQNVFDSEQFI